MAYLLQQFQIVIQLLKKLIKKDKKLMDLLIMVINIFHLNFHRLDLHNNVEINMGFIYNKLLVKKINRQVKFHILING
jgi:hypothetical protein